MPRSTGCALKISAFLSPVARSSSTKTSVSTAAYAPESAPLKPSASILKLSSSPSPDRAALSANNVFQLVQCRQFQQICREGIKRRDSRAVVEVRLQRLISFCHPSLFSASLFLHPPLYHRQVLNELIEASFKRLFFA